MHPVPLRLPPLLLLLRLQPLLPRTRELPTLLEVLQRGPLRVLKTSETGVGLGAFVFQELLEGLHYLGLVLDWVRQKFLLVKEAEASEVRKEGVSGGEAFEVDCGV